MKKTRFAVFFAALMAMLSFTSCLDSDGGSSTNSMYTVLKVNGFTGDYWFTDAAGCQYVPSSQNGLANSGLEQYQYAFVGFTYDASQVTQDTKKIIVDLYAASPVKTYYADEAEGDEMKEYSNASFQAVSTDISYNMYVTFFSRNDVFVPVSYYYKASSSNDELKAELNSHDFRLYFDKEQSSSSTMKLCLRHRVQDPTANKDRTTVGSEYLHFNLAQVMAYYRNLFNTTPLTIEIEYLYNYSSSELGDNPIAKQIEVDYKAWSDEFDKIGQ